MVCIQCYLPTIFIILYMKFLNPYVQPYVQPLFDRFVTYFWGPEALNASCPIRPKAAKKRDDGPEPSTSRAGGDDSASKSKDD